jgi:hypothetical protein
MIVTIRNAGIVIRGQVDLADFSSALKVLKEECPKF